MSIWLPLLMLWLNESFAKESQWCKKDIKPQDFCRQNGRGYYMSINRVTCTAHNFTINFIYFITDELAPKDISVKWVEKNDIQDEIDLQNNSGSITVTWKHNNKNNTFAGNLDMYFRKSNCNSGYQVLYLQGWCDFSCSSPTPHERSTTSTHSTAVDLTLSTIYKANSTISNQQKDHNAPFHDNSRSLGASSIKKEGFNISSKEKKLDHLWIIAIVCLVLLVIVLLGIGVYYLCRGGKKICEVNPMDRSRNPSSNETSLKSPTSTVKLLLLYANDHRKHVEVIRNFVNFLQADLGFQVFCELFQTQEYSQDPVSWMNKHKDEADKIVVVWSPEAARRWSQYGSTKTSFNDSFTPILKQIYDDVFRNIDVGRYYFGYFDYCSKDIIPPEFNEKRVSHFKLMKQFDELYFLLRGMKKYVPEGIISVKKVEEDSYHLPEFNKYGLDLHNSIKDMIALAAENPEWHVKITSPWNELEERISWPIFVNIEDEPTQNVLLVRMPVSPACLKETDSLRNVDESDSYNSIEFSFDSCDNNGVDSGTADHYLGLPATNSGSYNSEILVSNVTDDKQRPTLGDSSNSELEISIDKQAPTNFDSFNSEIPISCDDVNSYNPFVNPNSSCDPKMPRPLKSVDSEQTKSNFLAFTLPLKPATPITTSSVVPTSSQLLLSQQKVRFRIHDRHVTSADDYYHHPITVEKSNPPEGLKTGRTRRAVTFNETSKVRKILDAGEVSDIKDEYCQCADITNHFQEPEHLPPFYNFKMVELHQANSQPSNQPACHAQRAVIPPVQANLNSGHASNVSSTIKHTTAPKLAHSSQTVQLAKLDTESDLKTAMRLLGDINKFSMM